MMVREFDFNVLKLLIDYIYTGKIEVTEQNVVVGLNTFFIISELSSNKWHLFNPFVLYK